jgi:hypothetical protein
VEKSQGAPDFNAQFPRIIATRTLHAHSPRTFATHIRHAHSPHALATRTRHAHSQRTTATRTRHAHSPRALATLCHCMLQDCHLSDRNNNNACNWILVIDLSFSARPISTMNLLTNVPRLERTVSERKQ